MRATEKYDDHPLGVPFLTESGKWLTPVPDLEAGRNDKCHACAGKAEEICNYVCCQRGEREDGYAVSYIASERVSWLDFVRRESPDARLQSEPPVGAVFEFCGWKQVQEVDEDAEQGEQCVGCGIKSTGGGDCVSFRCGLPQLGFLPRDERRDAKRVRFVDVVPPWEE